jgi:1-acyl-sn-glycerol-3-phosphate acyltransferase
LALLAALRIVLIALHTLFWAVPVVLLSLVQPYSRLITAIIRWWAVGNLWVCGVKVRATGQDRLDPRRVYLFMSNHQSQFDILALTAALKGFPIRWVAKQELRKVPVLGLCMRLTQQVLVDRQSRTQAVAVIRQVKKLLDAGISVIFFPEGTRSRDGRLLPFKPGGFAVAVEAGVPVVPVTIHGSRAVLPSGEWKVRSGTIEVLFGEPIQLATHLPKKMAREELLRQVWRIISASYQPEQARAALVAAPLTVPPPSSEPRTPL